MRHLRLALLPLLLGACSGAKTQTVGVGQRCDPSGPFSGSPGGALCADGLDCNSDCVDRSSQDCSGYCVKPCSQDGDCSGQGCGCHSSSNPGDSVHSRCSRDTSGSEVCS